MDIEHLRRIALSFPCATEDIKWEEHLCFSVGGKMFLITSPDEWPIRASFKVSEDDFDALCARVEGFGQAKHFARRKWIGVADIQLLNSTEWEHYLQLSYQYVLEKLTKKLRQELGL